MTSQEMVFVTGESATVLRTSVIFLNRIRLTTFDQVFESRIQFKLFYDPLTPAQRSKTWKILLPPRKVVQGKSVVKLDWDSNLLTRLGTKYDINGREIKNMIKTAHALAEAADETLDEKHIEMVNAMNEKWLAKVEEHAKSVVQT